LADLKDSVMLSSDENSLINSAITRVTKLQADIETITDELFKLDEEQKAKNPEMTTSYRQARAEIVRVISSINGANTKLLSSLNKLTQYQKQMKDLLKQLRNAQVSSEKAKDYLNDYMVLLYKTQLKIYDQDGDKIDDIRLFVNSDNFSETFVGNDLLESMTVQL
jgi:DNA repair exonuclease SbcCD ATPase subunit